MTPFENLRFAFVNQRKALVDLSREKSVHQSAVNLGIPEFVQAADESLRLAEAEFTATGIELNRQLALFGITEQQANALSSSFNVGRP